MNFRPLLLAALLASACGAAHAQNVGSVGAANQDATGEPPGGAPPFNRTLRNSNEAVIG